MKIVGRSDVGKVRNANEDQILFDAEIGVAILADGMGGLAAGEVASQTAAEVILKTLTSVARRDEGILRRAVSEANQQVLEISKGSEAAAMGTTVVVWLDAGLGQCFVAHVGDSRAYRWREGKLEQITEDHSVVQQMLNEGIISASEARVSPQRNVITRAVGLESEIEIDVRSWVLGPEDVYLLCSDGLTDMLTDGEVSELLAANLGTSDLHTTAQALIDAANAAGGMDNVSVILLEPS